METLHAHLASSASQTEPTPADPRSKGEKIPKTLRVLAFSGGGFDTVMQLGVAHAFLVSRSISPDVVTGISAGAIGAVSLAEILQTGAKEYQVKTATQPATAEEVSTAEEARVQAQVERFREILEGYRSGPSEFFRSFIPDTMEVSSRAPLKALELPIHSDVEREERNEVIQIRFGLIKFLNGILSIRLPVSVITRLLRRALEINYVLETKSAWVAIPRCWSNLVKIFGLILGTIHYWIQPVGACLLAVVLGFIVRIRQDLMALKERQWQGREDFEWAGKIFLRKFSWLAAKFGFTGRSALQILVNKWRGLLERGLALSLFFAGFTGFCAAFIGLLFPVWALLAFLPNALSSFASSAGVSTTPWLQAISVFLNNHHATLWKIRPRVFGIGSEAGAGFLVICLVVAILVKLRSLWLRSLIGLALGLGAFVLSLIGAVILVLTGVATLAISGGILFKFGSIIKLANLKGFLADTKALGLPHFGQLLGFLLGFSTVIFGVFVLYALYKKLSWRPATPEKPSDILRLFLESFHLARDLSTPFILKPLLVRLFDKEYYGKPKIDQILQSALARESKLAPDKLYSSGRHQPKTLAEYTQSNSDARIIVLPLAADLAEDKLVALPQDMPVIDSLLAATAVVPFFRAQIFKNKTFIDAANVNREPLFPLVDFLISHFYHGNRAPDLQKIQIFPVTPFPLNTKTAPLYKKQNGDGETENLNLLQVAERALTLQVWQESRHERHLTSRYRQAIEKFKEITNNPAETPFIHVDDHVFVSTSLHPIEPDDIPNLNAQLLATADNEKRRGIVVKAVAEGCRKTLEKILPNKIREVQFCRRVIALRVGKTSSGPLIPGGSEEIDRGPGVPEVCQHCSLYPSQTPQQPPVRFAESIVNDYDPISLEDWPSWARKGQRPAESALNKVSEQPAKLPKDPRSTVTSDPNWPINRG